MTTNTFSIVLFLAVCLAAPYAQAALVCTCTSESIYKGAGNYSILGNAITNTGTSTCTFDVGTSPGTAVTGSPYTISNGSVFLANDARAVRAMTDLQSAYNYISTLTATGAISGDMAGVVTTSGIWKTDAALANTGVWSFDAANAPNATFVIISGGAYTPAAGSRMVLLNGAKAENIIMATAGAVSTGAGVELAGVFVASGAITIGSGSTVHGRILSLQGLTTTSMTLVTAMPSTSEKCLCFPGDLTTSPAASPSTMSLIGTAAIAMFCYTTIMLASY